MTLAVMTLRVCMFCTLTFNNADRWSFGICLWEIFALGGTPYPAIPVEQLLDFLTDGNRMENPRDFPLEIYKIMQDCWQEEPDKRPKFNQISQSIGGILEQRASQVRPFSRGF